MTNLNELYYWEQFKLVEISMEAESWKRFIKPGTRSKGWVLKSQKNKTLFIWKILQNHAKCTKKIAKFIKK